MEQKIINLTAKDISYNIYGEQNSQTLVLIHGLTSAQQTWFPILDALTKEYKVITYDQRGHGQSASGEMDYSLTSMANDLNNILSELKIDNCYLLGHSFGARTALKYLEMFPEKVKAFIIEDQHIDYEKVKTWEQNLQKIELIKQIFTSDYTFESQQQAQEQLSKVYKPNKVEEFIKKVIPVQKDNQQKYKLLFDPIVRCLYNYHCSVSNFINLIKNLKIPMLIIKADPLYSDIKEPFLQTLKSTNSNIMIKEIKDAFHNVHGSKTEEFLAELIPFLKKL